MADLYSSRDSSLDIKRWISEIDAARKREKDWRKDGTRAEEIYEGLKKEEIPFNILYSNTETLSPALYGQEPRPVVQRRFKGDDDPIGRAAGMAGQRVLEFLLDTNSEEYTSFDSAMKDAVLDALVPGRGATKFSYDAEIVDVKNAGVVSPQIVTEIVSAESVIWKRLIIGYAKKWCNVPWIAFEMYLERDEVEELAGKQVAEKTTYVPESLEESSESEAKKKDSDSQTDKKVAQVYQIWDKKRKKVCHVSPNYNVGYMKEEDDPLELTGFFPIPEPLRLLRKSNNLSPTPLYSLYENQAKELNEITVRLAKIIKALKVRGVYDASIGEIEQVIKADDNTLVPAETASALQSSRGLEAAIWLMPIDKLMATAQQLYVARENVKKTIYEITGIADIMRGASAASETLGAQEIKQNWATLRLKKMQREVQRYVRESLRIMLEIAAKKFQVKTFAAMTGLPFSTAEDIARAQPIAAAVRQQQVAYGIQAQQTQAAGGQMSDPPPEVPPDVQKILSQIPWDSVLQTLKDDTLREYRVDIETNSTVDADATEDQQNMQATLTAMGQFIQGVTPLIVSGSMPFAAAQSILLAVVRRFRFGTEIEDQIKAMQPPQPPQDDGSKQKLAQAEAEKQQMQNEAVHKDREIALNKRESALEVREAIQSGKEELHKIQLDAHRQVDEAARSAHLTRVQKVADDGVARAKEIAKDVEVKHKAVEEGKRANEKVSKSQTDRMVNERRLSDQIAQTNKTMMDALAMMMQKLSADIRAERVPIRDAKGKVVGSKVKV